MIPVRVHVRDFLCYDQGPDGAGVTFDFEGATLWSISGDNGAGKSAIFDAIRYALYGEHRDGSQRDARLIRRAAESCDVGFEFLSDGNLYRVRRTIGRARGKSLIEPKTRQAALYDTAEKAWLPVPGTDREDGLDAWVRERIGLSYKTFIASVLLLQGESETLTRATSKERFEILSGLLGLQAYEQLEATAKDRARVHRTTAEQLDSKLEAHAAVSPDEIDRASTAVAAADKELESAQDCTSAAATLVAAARTHDGLVQELAKLNASLVEVLALLANAETIRREHAERTLLSQQLPMMRQALSAVAEATRCERDAAATIKPATDINVAALQKLLDDAGRAGEVASARVEEAGKIFRGCVTDLDALRPKLVAIENYAAAAERMAGLSTELKALEARLAGLEALERSCAEGRLLRDALPHIKLIRQCHSAVVTRQQQLTAVGTVAAWESNVAAAAKASNQARGRSELAERERAKASGALARTEQQSEDARSALKARETAKGEAVCSRCGQKVTAAHMKVELAQARGKVAETAAAMRVATTADRVASAAAAKAADEALSANTELAEAKSKRVEAAACAREAAMANAALEAAQAELTKASQGVRRLVRDATLEPPTLNIKTVEKEAGALPELERQLERLRSDEGAARGIKTQIERERSALVEIDKNLPVVEQKRVRLAAERLEKERDASQTSQTTAQKALQDAQQEAKRALKALQAGQDRLRDLENAARELRVQATRLREQAQMRTEALEPPVREALLKGDDSVATTAARRLADLNEAESAYDALGVASERRLALDSKLEATSQQVERTPSEHRISIGAAHAKQSEAATRLKDAQRLRDEAHEKLRELRTTAEVRRQLEADYSAARRKGTLYGRLGDLLGRSGLQAVLMDDAIAGISRLANETLNRISGGQLQVIIERETSGRGEDIKIHAVDLGASDDPLDIAFLSGSQKFRVAVALASGIGQYSAGAGRIRALIIDEGFGSLDDQGRQQMVDELHTLSEVLDRVIVISHQEDFRDRTLFPTGYVLRRANQRTEVLRFV